MKRKRTTPTSPKQPVPPPATTNRSFSTAQKARWITHGLILALAILLRLHFVLHAEWHARSDTRNFHEYACNVLSGKGWANYWFEDPRLAGSVYRQYHAPAYPLLLTGIYWLTGFDKEAYLNSPMAQSLSGAQPWPAIGFNPLYAYLFNILLDVVMIWSLTLLAYHYFNAWCAFGVQIIASLNVMWTPILISESLFNAVFALGLWALGTNTELRNLSKNILFSVALLLAVMTKPMGIVLAGGAGLLLLIHGHWRRIPTLALLVIPVMLYVGFMFWNSERVYGHAFFMSNRGEALANNTLVTELHVQRYEEAYGPLKQELNRMPYEWEVNERFQKIFWERIQEKPSLLAENYMRNFTSLFQLKPDWWLGQWTWLATYHKSPEVGRWHQRLFRIHYLTYPLGFIGLFWFFRKSPVPATCAILFVLLHAAVTFGHFRYMAPAAMILGWYTGIVIGKGLSRIPHLIRPPDAAHG